MQITKNIKDNGNIVFSYSPIKYNETLFKRLIIPEILILMISLAIYSFIPRLSILILLIITAIIISITILYRWLVYTENLNKKLEKKIVYESLNDIIIKDISSFGSDVIELGRKLIVNTGDYGEVKEKFVAVILSNGIELKYNIIYINRYDKIYVQEIDAHYKITSKDEINH